MSERASAMIDVRVSKGGSPAWYFVGGVLFALVGLTVLDRAFDGRPHDDTDPPGGRSGLSLYTDNATGVQYVGTPFGGLTPRLGSDGMPLRTR